MSEGVKVELPLKEWIAAIVAGAGLIAWLTTMHADVRRLTQDVSEIKADVKALSGARPGKIADLKP